ncbi:MAG: YitT family protein [Lachnospiraceae bacterium]|nr:YitT family protein [Lachnospiraceae bacterium]
MKKGRLSRDSIMENVVFKYFMVILGGFIYSVGVNIFVRPLGLYNGGVVGLAQLVAYFVERSIGRPTNIYAFVYVILNVPLLILAYRGINRRFFIRTLLGVGSVAFFGLFIKNPAEPLIDNILTASLVGGMITGTGTGLILLAGGSSGGMDIIGVFLSKKRPNASVGKVAILFNMLLFIAVLFVNDLEAVVYSVIVMVASSLTLDRIHYQNISARCMIFTKMDGLDKLILEKTYRGVTEWEGKGAYTGQGEHILVSCINKYEEREFLEVVKSIDPHAFVIIDENIKVKGNFLKKL